MYKFFDNDGKLISISDKKIISNGIKIVEKDFSINNIRKLENGCVYQNGEVIETQEYLNFLKQEKISKYKEIEKRATEARTEYLTAELLPESSLRTLKLEKLEGKRVELEQEFNEYVNNLVIEYGEAILKELI